MPRLAALLRAINVGGHTVRMGALKKEFLALGFSNVETFIASGNVVFDAKSRDQASLERRIARHLERQLGYDVATFIRSMDQLVAAAEYEAFAPSAVAKAGAHCVAFVAEPLDARRTTALMNLRSDIDDLHPHGREIYWLCRKKQSESRFSNVMLERALRIQATFRGMTTIRKMADRFGRPATER